MQAKITYAPEATDDRLMELAFDPLMANQSAESRSIARELIETRIKLKRLADLKPPVNVDLLVSILTRHQVEYVAVQRDGQILRYKATEQFASLLEGYRAYRDMARE